MSRLISLAAVLAFVLAAPSSAAEKVTDRDRFKLWNDCHTMGLVVADLDEDATGIGLTKEAVTVAVRSRLRAARLYRASPGVPSFGAAVTVAGSAFGVVVTYSKWVKDKASGISRGADTWRKGATGTHGRDQSYILSSVSRQVDKFIDEYLRVNADACR